jgi:hypothetical protein
VHHRQAFLCSWLVKRIYKRPWRIRFIAWLFLDLTWLDLTGTSRYNPFVSISSNFKRRNENRTLYLPKWFNGFIFLEFHHRWGYELERNSSHIARRHNVAGIIATHSYGQLLARSISMLYNHQISIINRTFFRTESYPLTRVFRSFSFMIAANSFWLDPGNLVVPAE